MVRVREYDLRESVVPAARCLPEWERSGPLLCGGIIMKPDEVNFLARLTREELLAIRHYCLDERLTHGELVRKGILPLLAKKKSSEVKSETSTSSEAAEETVFDQPGSDL
jgi:hypothetical protein